ncbi:protein phosphatase 2A structural subunit TPD3 [Ascoidea rubescens DSM 1968]|uniref:ARM repeat-containing protein n=1 Tax=Ascoidea rubescens DSM 1968 TaxID=1344418 RepID=A0A1D2VLY4_9ASCO|nr:ARM repeat-containing protein [Ascoidea rubescens DSM 1968]ODV62577.1 ARM repeat-containing protein [Ascoidea rubescens DSM 1968]
MEFQQSQLNQHDQLQLQDSDQSQNDSINEILYPLALLMDELKHDDVQTRVLATQRLDTIAIALGPERARNELIPFLQDVAQDDEEEVFAVLAEKLNSNFVNYLGGPSYATILLPILQILCSMEEPIVRDKAINSLNDLATILSQNQINNDFLNLISQLSQGDWFSSRVASCGLFRSVLIKVDSTKRKNLLSAYLKLIQDDSPMVKRAAGNHLSNLIDLLSQLESLHQNKNKNTQNNLENSNINNLEANTADDTDNLKIDDNNLTITDKNDTHPISLPDPPNNNDWELIFQMFNSLTNDEQDSVKFLSVDVLISILNYFNHHKEDSSHNQDLLEIFLKLCTDESWRVRYMIADKFQKIALYYSSDDIKLKLLPQFISLMQDNEAEVRKAISKQLTDFSKLIPSKEIIINRMIYHVVELANDKNEAVRSSLASEITGLAPLLGKTHTTNSLLPIFLSMLKDDFPEVRLNIISKLTVVNDVIGIKLLSNSLLPAITELAKDKQWRVRLAIIKHIPLLAKQLGITFFNRELGSLSLSWLWDSVYSIRNAAVNNLKQLTEIFGAEWAKTEVIKKILNNEILESYRLQNPELFENQGEVTQNQLHNQVIQNRTDTGVLFDDTFDELSSSLMNNFIYRITCLFTLKSLTIALANDKDLIINDILPFILKNAKDDVANIRFNVATTLLTITQVLLNKFSENNSADDNLENVNKNINSFSILENNNINNNTNNINENDKKEDPSKLKVDDSPEDIEKYLNIINTQIVKTLTQLASDKDEDVRFFSNKSLNAVQTILSEFNKKDSKIQENTESPK